jgi:hypothetical protein
MLTLLSPVKAEAGQYAALAQAISASQPQAATLQQVGYYGGGDYYGDDQKQDDYGYGQKQDEYGGAGGEYGGGQKYGYGDNGGDSGYRYHRKRHDDYPDGCCNNGCYKKKWVCEESVPRCFKQRECVWHYGKEYCRYVRRCHGGGDRYCKWISVPSHNCGY